MIRPLAAGLASVAIFLGSVSSVRADEETQVYARVIVDSTALRSGPGTSFRRVYVAHRGDVFPVRERASRGYWWRVELPDGTHGWVLGDAVYNHDMSEEQATRGRFMPWLFAPAPLPGASGELAAQFGVLGSGGFMALRPTILFDATFGLEINAGASVARGGRLFFGGLGGIVNLFPSSPVVPFVVAGAGMALSDPNADTFLLDAGSTHVLYGGGGLRFGLRYRLTIRLEARAYAFYDADRYVPQEEYSGGITVFF